MYFPAFCYDKQFMMFTIRPFNNSVTFHTHANHWLIGVENENKTQ